MKKLIIRNKPFGITDILSIVFFVLYFFLVLVPSKFNPILSILVLPILLLMYLIIVRTRDKTDKIIIDESGIMIVPSNLVFEWADIRYAYIRQFTTGIGKSARVVDYFIIETKDHDYKIPMSDYRYNSNLLAETVNSYSGRQIGYISSKLNKHVLRLLNNKEQTEQAYHLFKNYYKRQINWGILSTLALIALSAFLQFIIDYPYVFAIGFTFGFLVLFTIGSIDEKRMRNSSFLKDVDDKTFDAINKEYAKEFDMDQYMTKTGTILCYALIIIGILALFAMSYIVSQ